MTRQGKMAWLALCAAGLTGSALAAAAAGPLVEDGEISKPLTDRPGNTQEGKRIALDPGGGNCVLCHALPNADAPSGDIGPPLAGVGARTRAGALRLRLVDATRLNPDSVMPAYHRTEGLAQVDARYRGRPILTAQQIEDLVAYLLSLK